MPATLEQTTADPTIVEVTCERSSPQCISSAHSRSASGSSDGSQPGSPLETSEKKGISRVSLHKLLVCRRSLYTCMQGPLLTAAFVLFPISPIQ